jgi:DNA-binding beta-propeller fold protein YncE/mono/diheme cytochrome c family protein
MRARFLAPVLALSAGVLLYPARSDAKRMFVGEREMPPPAFALDGASLGGPKAPAGVDARAPAHLAGGTIAALGDGALVIDPDSGELVRVDRAGKVTARLPIGPTAAQLVVDRARNTAYVSDRRGDRVVVVDLAGETPKVRDRWRTPAEPFGLALSPDGKTLLVTTVADRTLVAFDSSTGADAGGKVRWRRALGVEPRGVAISPDGERAMVTYLTSSHVDGFDLADPSRRRAIPLGHGKAVAVTATTDSIEAATTGRRFPRNAFAVRFVGNDLAIVPHQVSTPLQETRFGENTGSYGGGFESPIHHALTIIASADRELPRQVAAQIAAHQPRAMAWDPGRDRLIVAGHGSDSLLVVDAASQAGIRHVSDITLGDRSCGPEGVAFADDGDIWVYCTVSRKTARVTIDPQNVAKVTMNAVVAETRLSELEHQGFDLFRRGNDFRLSSRGSMACASCHAEVRTDGLSWRIESQTLQTPVLSGRVASTHPYKWDGGDATLEISLSSTMRRLGGGGLRKDENRALAAFLESVPSPRTPTRAAAEVARGKRLFASAELGCSACHGGSRLTDRTRHDLAGTLDKVDTPSLIGLASSAPYYHDGSAATLEALLTDRGLVHGMADVTDLSDAQVADLVAYLETL